MIYIFFILNSLLDKFLSTNFSTINFNHICRETNFVADKPTNFEHEIHNVYVWFNYLPLSVYPTFYLNKM